MPHSANVKPRSAAPALPLRLQVYRQLRAAIEQGSLPAGARLPPSRQHAASLGVSRNTVLWALERLQAEGYVLARVGDGSYVAAGVLTTTTRETPHARALPALSRRGQLLASSPLRWSQAWATARPFRIGGPEIATFPFALWDRLTRQLSPAERQALAQYTDPAGLMELREAIAQWLWASRGVRCLAAQVLVCSGSQQALDLIARMLLDPGDEVMVEDPGYTGIRAALVGHGALVRPVPVDEQGLDIAHGAARWPNAKLLVTTPTHQFPLGVRMSLQRRQAVLAWARTQGGWVVEDDYDSEFQYGAHRIPALTSLPQADRVLYVGTFSKTLHPGLRMGFVVLPQALVPAFATARTLTDRHAPGEQQAVLARFIAQGHLLRHLNRMRELYPQRQQVLIQAIDKATKGQLRLAPAEQGMHLCAEIEAGGDDQSLSDRALQAGVLLAPLARYCIASPRRGWLFGYAGYDTASLRDAAAQLGSVWV